jgi:hypothetical protein
MVRFLEQNPEIGGVPAPHFLGRPLLSYVAVQLQIVALFAHHHLLEGAFAKLVLNPSVAVETKVHEVIVIARLSCAP